MCGIVGVLNFDGRPVCPQILRKMTDAISHRGPDGEGQIIHGNVGIGHRRLSIIDTSSAGAQPMVSSDGSKILSYNGEIYNFEEIKKDLEANGFRFRSKTDTEVVLNALIFWGKDALLKFNGMFALAYWDRKNKTILLARDRYGVKPLYYAQQNEKFFFSSENKAIINSDCFEKQINLPALLEYFTFQNIFTDQTLVKDVSILPAGHSLEIFIEKNSQKLERYWDYHFREPQKQKTKIEYEDDLCQLFQTSVKRQLIGDVEVGAYLSGGVDSGSITAVASKIFPNLKNFTVGFDLSSASGLELGFDERDKAEAMSAFMRTEHYEMVLKAGDMERCLPNLIWHLEEPRVGQSYPNYYAAQLASKFVKVVLSGTGGDELFGGYPWRYFKGAQNQSFQQYIDQYYLYWQRLLSNAEIRQVFAPVWGEVKHVWTRDIFEEVFATHDNQLKTPEDFVNHSLYFEAKTFLHGLFVVEDKISMAHGLESRVPFMDNDLVNFAMECPVEFKLNNFKNHLPRINENEVADKQTKKIERALNGKSILRDVMSRFVSEQISAAPKQGFSSPDASWFKGDSIDFVNKTLLEGSPEIYKILDKSKIKSLIDEHCSGEQNRRLLIWSLLSTENYIKEVFT